MKGLRSLARRGQGCNSHVGWIGCNRPKEGTDNPAGSNHHARWKVAACFTGRKKGLWDADSPRTFITPPQNFCKSCGGKGGEFGCLVRFILPRIFFSFFWKPMINTSQLFVWKYTAGIFEYFTFNSRVFWTSLCQEWTLEVCKRCVCVHVCVL